MSLLNQYFFGKNLQKMKKNNKENILVIIIVLLAIGFTLYIQPFSIIEFGNLPPTIVQENWNGLPLIITTLTLNPVSSQTDYSNLCGDSDGDIKLNNGYNLGNDLTLTSSASTGDDSMCSGAYNYIFSDLTLPKGILTINFEGNTGVASQGGGTSETIIKVESDGQELYKRRSYQVEPNIGGAREPSVTEIKEIIIDNSSIIHIELLTTMAGRGSASGKIILSFLAENNGGDGSIPDSCALDVLTCADGSTRSRNILNNCEFDLCNEPPQPPKLINTSMIVIILILIGVGIIGYFNFKKK